MQIEELKAEIKDKVENQQKLEEERKEQIALIKKVNAVLGLISEKQTHFVLFKQYKCFRDANI